MMVDTECAVISTLETEADSKRLPTTAALVLHRDP